jgi:nucleotide-binding universal stress UspA family protein
VKRSAARPVHVLATDGSPASQKALEFAVARSKEAGARLIVAMAVDPVRIGAPSSAGGPDIDLAALLEKEAQEVVGLAAERARKAHVKAVGKVSDALEGHDVATAVVQFAKEQGAQLIVVGSHGRTGIVATMLGSTAEKIARLAHCPVSIVR